MGQDDGGFKGLCSCWREVDTVEISVYATVFTMLQYIFVNAGYPRFLYRVLGDVQ